MKNVLFLLQLTSLLQKFAYGGTYSSDEEREPKRKRIFNTWSSKMDAQLTELYKKHKSDEPYHFERVKNEWYNLNPNSNMSTHALHYRFLKIYHRLEGEGTRPKHEFKWDEKKHEDLTDAYVHTYPYDRTCSNHLSDEWLRRHPDSPNYTNSVLTRRVRRWIKSRKINLKREQSRRLFEWTSRQDSDLFLVNQITLPEGQKRMISMHRIFTDLHPDLRDLTAEQMTERVEYLQRNPPDEHFPWTKEQDKELLDIYQSTSPEIANQEQRIYDIFTKIHPRYKFLTPYYLQVYASTLAHNEAAAMGGRRKVAMLTDEQKTNLIDMYRRLAKPHKLLYDFHKAWVREYPSLAYITPSKLALRAKRTATKDNPSTKDEAEPSSSRSRRYEKYTPEEKAELIATYKETYPREFGHFHRLHEKWTSKGNKAKDIKAQSLREVIQRWMREASNKKGKEPMITPKTEVESELSSGASDMSQ